MSFLKSVKESVKPTVGVAVVESAGPHAELLAVIPYRKKRGGFVETFAQDCQCLVRLTKRNGVAERLKARDQLDRAGAVRRTQGPLPENAYHRGLCIQFQLRPGVESDPAARRAP